MMLKFGVGLSLVMIVVCEGPPIETDYVLNFASPVYVCHDDISKTFVDTSGVEVLRLNETTAVMTGYFNFYGGMDHDTMLEIWIEKEISGRFELLISHEICDLCSHMGDPESYYYSYIKYFGFPEKCPFEAGKYDIHDMVTDTTDIPVNGANAGRYQVTMNFYQTSDANCKIDRTFVGCLKLDCLIELA